MPTKRRQPAVESQDRSEEAARLVGRVLRDARVARGEDLSDIAAFLRIRQGYLAALEAGDLDTIPGRPYAAGFLRSYGRYLDLDGDELAGRLRVVAGSGKVAPTELSPREPFAERRRATAAMVTVSLLLAAGVYGGYYAIYRTDRGPVGPEVAEAPGEAGRLATDVLRRSDAAVAASSAAGIGVAAPPPDDPAPAASVAEEPAVVAFQAREPGADAASAVAAERPAGPARGPAPAVPGDAASAVAGELQVAARGAELGDAGAAAGAGVPVDEASRVTLVAVEGSWVQVRSPNRDYVRVRTLQPGERLVLPNRADLALLTGNAGGLELVVDGQSLGRLGASGEVVKNLALVPDQLKARPVQP